MMCIAQIRSAGTKLFLCTNSGSDYAEFLLGYAYGGDWHTLFDAVVFDARKPGHCGPWCF